MKILFTKEIEGAGSHHIDLMNDAIGDSAIETVYLQLLEDDTMTVKGQSIDKSGVVASDMAIIADKDFAITNEVSSAGLYFINSVGLSSIEIALTAGKKVIVKAIY